MIEKNDEYFMRKAFALGLEAFQKGEVPIGAVIVKNGIVIGEGYNQVELLRDATAHAEMIALTSAENYEDNWRLIDCTLYVTVEPCMMCTGAILLSRVGRIVYGVADPRMGFMETKFNGVKDLNLYKKVEVFGGIMESEIRELMQDFFKKIRNKSK
ncbi:MAG: nucleoside deaminase [Candidatus Cloacimonetes bacterium]|jgi:tRNA(adenine34) deaminase|nr:nucleoside deaminase [Candidatus Cloacimonadota bacterium]